ncbi:uncharacterized protein LOC144747505 [Ciona intestinalis]
MFKFTSVCVVLVSIVACAAAARTNQDIKEIAQAEISKNQNSAKLSRMGCEVDQYYLASMCHQCLDICEDISTQKECKENCLAMYVEKWGMVERLEPMDTNSQQIEKLNDTLQLQQLQIEKMETKVKRLEQENRDNRNRISSLELMIIASLSIACVIVALYFLLKHSCGGKKIFAFRKRKSSKAPKKLDDVESQPLKNNRDKHDVGSSGTARTVTGPKTGINLSSIQASEDNSNETRQPGPA